MFCTWTARAYGFAKFLETKQVSLVSVTCCSRLNSDGLKQKEHLKHPYKYGILHCDHIWNSEITYNNLRTIFKETDSVGTPTPDVG